LSAWTQDLAFIVALGSLVGTWVAVQNLRLARKNFALAEEKRRREHEERERLRVDRETQAAVERARLEQTRDNKIADLGTAITLVGETMKLRNEELMRRNEELAKGLDLVRELVVAYTQVTRDGIDFRKKRGGD